MLPLFLASTALATEGAGRATIVWMQADLPSPELRQKAEKIVGSGAVHAAWADLAFVPAPASKDDDARYAALARATEEGRGRWDTFDAEGELAAGLGSAVSAIDVVRDDADRKVLAQALLLQGAAVTRLVPESKFATAEEVASYRVYVGASSVERPYVDALALEPGNTWVREDLPDALSFARLDAAREDVRNQAVAKLEVAPLPAGVSLVVDGRPVDAKGALTGLSQGRHYVHALVGGKIVGRKVVDAAADGAVTIEPTVTREELDAAGARVLEGSKDVPADVAHAVDAVGLRNGAPTPTFLATLDDKGRVQVVPYGGGAAFKKARVVTVLLAGDVGGGILRSPGFIEEKGEQVTAPAVGGNLGAEVGIYNLAIYAGTSLTLTPTERQRFANAENTKNVDTNAYFHPYGGIGLYLPRPNPRQVLVLIGADYGWMSPGSTGVGGKLALGIPSGDGTWFRIDADVYRGMQMENFPGDGDPSLWAGLRLGFGRMF